MEPLAQNDVKKTAFTLAEVLITLGIIGVVAAMTMPVITKSYRKQVIESSLEKFYTNMNQAMKMSTLENGEYKDWEMPYSDRSVVVDIDWYNKYLKNYLKDVKLAESTYMDTTTPLISVYLADGTVFGISDHDYYFCLDAKSYKKFLELTSRSEVFGSSCFTFGFYPVFDNNKPCVNDNYRNKGLEPYISYADTNCSETEYYLKSPAKTIQMNGWKIPKNYPWKY